MTLPSWLALAGVSRVEFAKMIGVKRRSVDRYVNAERFPPYPILKRIAWVTNMAVTPNDFCNLDALHKDATLAACRKPARQKAAPRRRELKVAV